MSANETRSVPDLILERYRLGELPPQEMDRVRTLVEADESLRDRLAALEESDKAIARDHPAEWLAGRIREKTSNSADGLRTRPRTIHPLAVAAALAAAAVVMVFAIPWRSVVSRADDDRIKGLNPTLAVYRRTAQGSETLANGAPARAGDLLRLGYISAGRGYGVILSIDGRGVVTLHLPPNGTRAASLRTGGMILLDQAYELDDAPAWERFYFVTADKPFEVGPILEAARRAAGRNPRSAPDALPIPDELQQTTFSIQKEVRP